MQRTLFQVDAFTDQLFSGNPAAVVPLTDWLPDETLQSIAAENNLAETAFFVPVPGVPDRYHIRWFTPTVEVQLCGHATLATAFVLFNCLKANQSGLLTFDSKSGPLRVQREADGWLTLDFPTDHLHAATLPAAAADALDDLPREVWLGREDYLLVYDSLAQVQRLAPDFRRLAQAPVRGFIATAPGIDVDFVSRCFFPAYGIDEDPVTGSAHTTLMPFWAERIGKKALTARQISQRGGYLRCLLEGARTLISGQAVVYLEGKIWV